MNVKCKCRSCGKEAELTENIVCADKPHLVHKNPEFISGKTFYLTTWKCKVCGCTNIVQVDDENSLGMLDECKKMFIRCAVKKSKGKSVKVKENKHYKKALKDLSSYRKNLEKEFTETFEKSDYAEDNNYIISFAEN